MYLVIIGLVSILVLTAAIIKNNTKSTNNLADAEAKLNYQEQLAKKQCATQDNPVINITQKVINDADSGQAGNYWAFDTLERHMQVWKQTDNSYCGIVEYNGQFDAQPGKQSPGNTATLTGNEDGTVHGGYRTIILGTLKDNPSWTTNGYVGLTDNRCDLNGNCPGEIDWIGQYFTTGYTSSMPWWGWIYKNGQHTWINSSEGNSGDIL